MRRSSGACGSRGTRITFASVERNERIDNFELSSFVPRLDACRVARQLASSHRVGRDPTRSGPEMVPPSLSFAAFCELLHSIACIPPVKAGREPDAVLVKSCFSAWVEVVTRPGQLSPGTGVQLFRLLFPEEGTRRRYDMKETLLAKAIVVHYRQAGHPLDPVFEQGWNETELDLENSRSSGCLGLELREHLAGNSFAAGEITIAEYVAPHRVEHS